MVKKEKALRFNMGKAELHYLLTFPIAVKGVAKVSSYGTNKYSPYNYLKGATASQSIGSAMRHLLAWWNGEDIDLESGLNHLDHFVWNAMRLTDEMQNEKFVDLDDRPCKILKVNK